MTFEYQKYVLPMRRRWQALGRTTQNKPRRNRSWPALAGLSGREYLKAYIRLVRTEQRAVPGGRRSNPCPSVQSVSSFLPAPKASGIQEVGSLVGADGLLVFAPSPLSTTGAGGKEVFSREAKSSVAKS